MRFATLILFYDCDQFILRTIENCAPHVEKIFITYSPLPWGYNPEARDKYRNPSDLTILKQSKHLDQIELIEGDWLTEEAQRNEVLVKAKAEGFDYLIVQDADEFFCYDDYAANLKEIEANPGFAYYRTPWYQFWKSLDYVLIHRYSYTYRNGAVDLKLFNTQLSYSMAFALNLKLDVRFDHCRRPTMLDDYRVLARPCYHLSYVLADEQVERKIRTYGHTNQIDHDRWLRHKWYGWNESTQNLHPLNPIVWSRAKQFRGELPKELTDFPQLEQRVIPLKYLDRLKDRIAGIYYRFADSLKRSANLMRNLLRRSS